MSQLSEPRVREAVASDADEILRLAYEMWKTFPFEANDDKSWHDKYREVFTRLTHENRLRAYVVDDPHTDGRLIACGVGLWYEVLPAWWIRNGRLGYLQWFSTEPAWRNQGLGDRILAACRTWLVDQGCTRIHLHSAPRAESLYERKDFERNGFANMWWRAPEGR